jgi:hypothetical protein
MIALVIRGARGKEWLDRRVRLDRVGVWLAAWSALMLLAVEIGLAWHSYG